MKRFFSFIVCFTLLASVSQADLILLENFEDNNFNFTTSNGLFHNSGSSGFQTTQSYFTVVGGNFSGSEDPYTGYAGSRFFAAENIDDGSRPATQRLMFNVNITGFEDITLSMLFAAGGNFAESTWGNLDPRYDLDDGFQVRARIDNGSFQNLLSFEATGTDTQTRRDWNFNGVGEGNIPSASFGAYNGLAIAGTGSNLLVEIVVSSNDDGVEYAFDNITINGTAVPEPSALAMVLLSAMTTLRRRRRQVLPSL